MCMIDDSDASLFDLPPFLPLQFGSGGDLSLRDPLDSPQSRFGLEHYEFDVDCDRRSGLAPFQLPESANGAFSSQMLTGGELFQCKEVECYAVNIE